MKASLTKHGSSQPGGDSSNGSAYPASEIAYFRRVYGSDHLHQLHDGHQEKAIYRYVLPHKKAEVTRLINRLSHLHCENDEAMTAPGRSAYSIRQLDDNLKLYCSKQCRSLRWNEHYRAALDLVASSVYSLLKDGRCLQPMAISAVAASDQLSKNLDKNAGYYGFETGKRSKGENLENAVKWCESNVELIYKRRKYGFPFVISHRSSNSKPTSDTTWKWRCRVILMQDIRGQLYDGRFALPFTELFKRCEWGEGSMTQEDVRYWVHRTRRHYDRWYSSDYSKFDTSQPGWLLEDVFYHVIRPLFGQLSDFDSDGFETMVNSYIVKEIHGPHGRVIANGCQVSGSLMTYAINTIVNQIVDLTSLLMQGCNPKRFKSLKCGDDNLTYYMADEPWDRIKHCELIERYFGIKTTLTEDDCGQARSDDPKFLSRIWRDWGEDREIREVLFNLLYPERYRDYTPSKTHVSERRAAALVLFSSCLEQDATMRRYFDVRRIRHDAEIRRMDSESTYTALAKLGSGFNDPWIRYHESLKITA